MLTHNKLSCLTKTSPADRPRVHKYVTTWPGLQDKVNWSDKCDKTKLISKKKKSIPDLTVSIEFDFFY